MLVVPQFRGLTERGLTEFLAALARTDSPDAKTPAHQLAYWKLLDDQQRRAACVLGYGGQSWDDGAAPHDIRDASWHELSAKQQSAAQILGYDEDTWNQEMEQDMAERAAQEAEAQAEAQHMQYMAELGEMLRQAQIAARAWEASLCSRDMA